MIAAPDSTARAALARDLLGGLAEGRDGWARTLFETLATFFECGRSVRSSASRLHVHENTIRNRMESIHRQIGLDILRSADDQLTAQIALTVFAVGPT
jgi:DNA-binding PucR family transcriptional regulator